ncbi:hypothetical protein L1887_50233 [Cichorium endivia]|nr:hypothetical protein L1887_50233 [Cichorium endivia]
MLPIRPAKRLGWPSVRTCCADRPGKRLSTRRGRRHSIQSPDPPSVLEAEHPYRLDRDSSATDSACRCSCARPSSFRFDTKLSSDHANEKRILADKRSKKNCSDQHVCVSGGGGLGKEGENCYRTRELASALVPCRACLTADEDAITRPALIKCPVGLELLPPAGCSGARCWCISGSPYFARVKAEHEWRSSSRAWPRAERVSLPLCHFHPLHREREALRLLLDVALSCPRVTSVRTTISRPFVPLLLGFPRSILCFSSAPDPYTSAHQTHSHQQCPPSTTKSESRALLPRKSCTSGTFTQGHPSMMSRLATISTHTNSLHSAHSPPTCTFSPPFPTAPQSARSAPHIVACRRGRAGRLAQRTVKAIRYRTGLRVTHVDASAPHAAPTLEARPILNSISSTSPLHLLEPFSPPLLASAALQRSIGPFLDLMSPGHVRDHISRSCCSRSARLPRGVGRTNAGLHRNLHYDAAHDATVPRTLHPALPLNLRHRHFASTGLLRRHPLYRFP